MALSPALLGQLRTVTYDAPPALALLNPPAKSGTATLRRWSPGAAAPIDYAYASATGTSDQINCALRDVGTFPVQASATNFVGVVAPGAPAVLEVRQDMKALALGETGFNIPSLVGLSAGAPYFHAGNARTLEEAFDDVFQKHHAAFNRDFLPSSSVDRKTQVAQLVAYLLSLDDTAVAPVSPQKELTDAGVPAFDFDPDLCAHPSVPIR
jgi:hypothetical protein